MEYTLCLAGGADPVTAFKEIESVLAREFARKATVERRRFVMTDALVRKVAAATKTTTIRIDRKAVEYPVSAVLPLFATRQASVAVPAGNVLIDKVVYKRLGDLTRLDARRDGFATRRALMSALKRFYGALNRDELVSIYAISAIEEPAISEHSI